MTRTTLEVRALTRVEGEGALRVVIEDDRVIESKLVIFEPPRFFEAFLRGRSFEEAPDITARICGICPVAYQMSAVHAMEQALGVEVGESIRALRRLLYCGEWIESHVLHVYFLHGPDFLGYPDVIGMSADHPQRVEQALALKKLGNALVELLGGRAIHPINVRVGGFFSLPEPSIFRSFIDRLKWGRDAAVEMVKWAATLPFPSFEHGSELVALRAPDARPEYPFNEGRIVSSEGLSIPAAEFNRFIEEEHVAHSNALQARIKSRGAYLTGPLARFELNFDRLTPLARSTAQEVGFVPRLPGPAGVQNSFRSIIARAVETVFAFEEALSIVEAYQPPPAPSVAVALPGRPVVGHAATEAPRGMLYHRYALDAAGLITEAQLVPPTSQNQRRIELELGAYVEQRLPLLSRAELSAEALTRECEQLIRNYDPCISCATHFLKLELVSGRSHAADRGR